MGFMESCAVFHEFGRLSHFAEGYQISIAWLGEGIAVGYWDKQKAEIQDFWAVIKTPELWLSGEYKTSIYLSKVRFCHFPKGYKAKELSGSDLFAWGVIVMCVGSMW